MGRFADAPTVFAFPLRPGVVLLEGPHRELHRGSPLLGLPQLFHPRDEIIGLVFHIVILLFAIVSEIEGSFTPTRLVVFDQGVGASQTRLEVWKCVR